MYWGGGRAIMLIGARLVGKVRWIWPEGSQQSPTPYGYPRSPGPTRGPNRRGDMRHGRITTWWVVAGFALGLPLSGIAEDQSVQGPLVLAQAEKPKGHAPKIPVYKPPRRGAPAAGRRVGGGTRGMNKSLPVVSVLAPDHTGLTVQEQPALYWFASAVVDAPIELTVIDGEGIQPLLETRLARPHSRGYSGCG